MKKRVLRQEDAVAELTSAVREYLNGGCSYAKLRGRLKRVLRGDGDASGVLKRVVAAALGSRQPKAEKSGARSSKKPHLSTAVPETIEWARAHFDEEEIVAGLREVRRTGGLELRDFVRELEEAAGPDE